MWLLLSGIDEKSVLWRETRAGGDNRQRRGIQAELGCSPRSLPRCPLRAAALSNRASSAIDEKEQKRRLDTDIEYLNTAPGGRSAGKGAGVGMLAVTSGNGVWFKNDLIRLL